MFFSFIKKISVFTRSADETSSLDASQLIASIVSVDFNKSLYAVSHGTMYHPAPFWLGINKSPYAAALNVDRLYSFKSPLPVFLETRFHTASTDRVDINDTCFGYSAKSPCAINLVSRFLASSVNRVLMNEPPYAVHLGTRHRTGSVIRGNIIKNPNSVSLGMRHYAASFVKSPYSVSLGTRHYAASSARVVLNKPPYVAKPPDDVKSPNVVSLDASKWVDAIEPPLAVTLDMEKCGALADDSTAYFGSRQRGVAVDKILLEDQRGQRETRYIHRTFGLKILIIIKNLFIKI